MFKNIWIFFKFLNKENIKVFLWVFYYNFLLTELKELYFSFELFFYNFFFLKRWTITRFIVLCLGWFFLIIPILLILILFYRIFIVSFIKLLFFLLDYLKLYKEYAIFKHSEKFRGNNIIVLRSWVKELPIIHRRKKGKWIKIDPYVFEEKIVVEVLKTLSLSKHDLFPSVTRSLLKKLRERSIKISADDMWKVFIYLSQNSYNHYIDNFSNVFLLYAINWEKAKYFSYLKRRKKVIRWLDGIIPFYFFFFFSSECWKRLWKWLVIDTIISFIRRLDWTVFRFLKRIEFFILYRIPRYNFLFYNRIYVPLDYMRAKLEYNIWKRYKHRGIYYILYKWSIKYFFKYGIKRFIKRFIRRFIKFWKFLFICFRASTRWLKWHFKFLIYYFLWILFFPINVIVILGKFLINIAYWIFFHIQHSVFWKKYLKIFIINRVNYIWLLFIYYFKKLNSRIIFLLKRFYFFFDYFLKLILFYWKVIKNKLKSWIDMLLAFVKKIFVSLKIFELKIFFYFSYLKILSNYLKQVYYGSAIVNQIIFLKVTGFFQKLDYKFNKKWIEKNVYIEPFWMYLKTKYKFVILKTKSFVLNIVLFFKKARFKCFVFLDNLEKQLVKKDKEISEEIKKLKNKI